MSTSAYLFAVNQDGFKLQIVNFSPAQFGQAMAQFPSPPLTEPLICSALEKYQSENLRRNATVAEFAIFKTVIESCERIYLADLESTDGAFLMDVGLLDLFLKNPPIAIPSNKNSPYLAGYVLAEQIGKHTWPTSRDRDVLNCRRKIVEIGKSLADQDLDLAVLIY